MKNEKEAERSPRILHLEDSPRDAEIIRERLIDAGFSMQMDWASNEQEFTSYLQRGGYDLILADAVSSRDRLYRDYLSAIIFLNFCF